MPSRKTRSTLRQHLIDTDARVRRELRVIIEDTAQDMKDYFLPVTRTWKRKVSFRRQMRVSPRLIEASVQAVGANKWLWIWTDKGTKPHIIRPKNTSLLTFKASYDARTRPPAGAGGRPRANVGTGKAIGSWVSTKEVRHPGTKPRQFAKYFEKQMKPNFQRRVEAALRRAAQ